MCPACTLPTSLQYCARPKVTQQPSSSQWLSSVPCQTASKLSHNISVAPLLSSFPAAFRFQAASQLHLRLQSCEVILWLGPSRWPDPCRALLTRLIQQASLMLCDSCDSLVPCQQLASYFRTIRRNSIQPTASQQPSSGRWLSSVPCQAANKFSISISAAPLLSSFPVAQQLPSGLPAASPASIV